MGTHPEAAPARAELIERADNARTNLKHLSANLGLSEDADVLDAGSDAIEALLTALSLAESRGRQIGHEEAAKVACDPEKTYGSSFGLNYLAAYIKGRQDAAAAIRNLPR